MRLQRALAAFEEFGQIPMKLHLRPGPNRITTKLTPQRPLNRLFSHNVSFLRSALSDRMMSVLPRFNLCGSKSFSRLKLVKLQVSGGRWEWVKTPAVSKYDEGFEVRACGPPTLQHRLSLNYLISQILAFLRWLSR